jgi:hypothetical protein
MTGALHRSPLLPEGIDSARLRRMTDAADKALRDIAATRQMANFSAANIIAIRVVVTAHLAGVELTDDRVATMLDALIPAARDPQAEFRNVVLGLIDDIRTTAALLKR